MRMILAGALVLVCGLAQPGRALACASCGCGDPTLTAMGFEKPFRHRIRLGLESRAARHEVPADGERTLVSRTTLSASYSPTAWLSLATQLPFAAAWSELGGQPSRGVYGLGDLDLFVRALPLRDRRFSPRHVGSVTLGLKFPTGPRRVDSTGYPAPDELQPGSGSWDGLFGLGYSYFNEAFAVFISASYRLTSRGYRNLRRGGSIGGTALLQLSLSRRIALQTGTELAFAERTQLENGGWATNRGGLLLSVVHSVVVALYRDWLLRLAVQSPVVQAWQGSQWESPTAVLSLAVDL